MTSDTSILALLGTTLVASLAGSLHCAGMCGGIALVAGGRGSGREIAIASGGYHGGRFVAYAALGAAAGLAGGVLDLGGNLIGIQRVASIVAGLTIAGLGLLHLARLAGLRLPAIGAFPPLVTAMRAMHGFAARLRPFPRGLTLGLGTPLLPCGWLWAFIAIAAGTGTALGGAAVLSAFWFGTVPALVAVTGGAGAMAALRSPRLAAAVPTVAALAMVAIGLQVALGRSALAEAASRVEVASSEVPLDRQVAKVASELPPCCRRPGPAVEAGEEPASGTAP
jgi:sulfite exporter TauE/SafE